MKSARLCFGCTLILFVISVPWASAAQPLSWDVLGGPASGPPYPTASNTAVGVYREGLLLPAVQRSLLLFSIQELLCDGSVRPSELGGQDNGVGDQPGTDVDLNFAIDFDIDLQASTRLLIESLMPDGKNGLPTEIRGFSWGESSFDVHFDQLLGDGSVHGITLHGEIAPDQPFAFSSFSASPGSVVIDFGLERLPGDHTLDEPIVVMSLTGEVVPEPATALLLVGGGSLLLRRRRA